MRKNGLSWLLAALLAALLLVPMISNAEEEMEDAPRNKDATIAAVDSNVKEAGKAPVVEPAKEAPVVEPVKAPEKTPAAEPAKEAPVAEPVKAPEKTPEAEPEKEAPKPTEPEAPVDLEDQPPVVNAPVTQEFEETQSGTEIEDLVEQNPQQEDKQPTVVRVRFLTERGTASFSSAEYVVGAPYGRLPSVALSEDEEYEFIGWADSGAAVSSSTVVTKEKDYTLHALFRELQPAEQTGEQTDEDGEVEDVPKDADTPDEENDGEPEETEKDADEQEPAAEEDVEAKEDAEPEENGEPEENSEPEENGELEENSEPKTDAEEGRGESGAEAEAGEGTAESTASETAEANPAEEILAYQTTTAADDAQATYRIVYHIIGGVGEAPEAEEISAEKLEEGYALSKPASVDGYAFKGWYLDEGMTGSPMMQLTEAKDAELYGIFLIDHYTVTYDANAEKDTVAGMPDPIVEFYACGDVVSVIEAVPQRAGYLFDGWSLTGATLSADKKSFVMPEQNVTLRAVWKPGTFVVSFVDDQGNKLLKDRSVSGGSKLPLPGYEVVKNGKIVVGWLDEAGREVSASQIVIEDMELTAIWEKAYTVTYKDGLKYVEVFKDQSYTAAAGSKTPCFWGEPYRKGYKFIGWRADGERGLGLYRRVNRDVTYYAVWERRGGKGDVPKTGDASGNGLLYAGVTLLTLAACCGYVRRKK